MTRDMQLLIERGAAAILLCWRGLPTSIGEKIIQGEIDWKIFVPIADPAHCQHDLERNLIGGPACRKCGWTP